MKRVVFCFLFFLVSAQFAIAQDSTIWESQVRAFEEKDLSQPPSKGETVAVGSSSIRLWSTIRSDLAPTSVVPRGIGGATTVDVLYYLDRLVLVYEPKRVLVYAGENDISALRSPQQLLDTTKAIVGRIHARLPSTQVYLLSIKPSILRWDRWPAMKSANDLLASYARSDPRIKFIDVSSPLLGADGTPVREYYLDDLLHLSKRGYEQWTKVIRPYLVESAPSAAFCFAVATTPWGTVGAHSSNCRSGASGS